jgi:DNA-binding transcriptional ArsR family regulator
MKTSAALTALAALAHEYRLAVYRMLVAAGPQGMAAGMIAKRLKMPASSLTFHLQNLQRSGLITQERMSRQLIYAADFKVMNGLVNYLTENCCAESGAACDPSCKPVRTSLTAKGGKAAE